ncbi:MAG: ABC transporter permease [Chloroflexota bacterium]|nr:ABC transporter permease [Chloroflexota bacterium]
MLGESAGRGIEPRRTRLESWRRLSRHRTAVAGLIVIFIMYFTAAFAPWLAPYPYTQQNLDAVEQPPSRAHPLGTDELGRDLLSRIIWGTRSAAFFSVTITVISLPLGLLMGALAGYLGGATDLVIMRISDFLFAFPGLLFVFFIAVTIKPSIVAWVRAIGMEGLAKSGYVNYMVVIASLAIVGWPGLARLVRGQILSLKEKEFVEGARAIGASPWHIIVKHLLPNAMPPIIVSVSMSMGGIILSEAILSFLGIGLQPPNPSWGALIYNNYHYWRTRPHMIIAPGLVLAAVIFAFNFLGDGLNEALSPGR